MGFFEAPPPEPKPKRRPRRRKRKIEEDSWTPPSVYLPRYLQRNFVLASSDEAAVVVEGIACYPNGFAFTLRGLTRFYLDDDDESARRFGFSGPSRNRDGDLPPGLLRFGIAFSDGAKGTTLDPVRWDDVPDGAIPLRVGAGSEGNGELRHHLWVERIPPPGPVEFVCEWPLYDIVETRRSIDGSHFVKASEKSTPIF